MSAKHQSADFFRMTNGETRAGSTAHGLCDKDGLGYSEMVEKVFEIVGKAGSIGATFKIARVAKATVIKSYHLKPTGKKRYLVKPRRVVAAHPVCKN